ncbi:hypothetical protein H4R24_003576 [Coemansia sp. RSA 988]|nr:hypothetical protein H4R24_003576 [Coemansia sp. RSA 988]
MGSVSTRTTVSVVIGSEGSSASSSQTNESESNSSRADSNASEEEEDEDSDNEHIVIPISIGERTNKLANGRRRTLRTTSSVGRNRRSIVEDSESESVRNTVTPPPEVIADASDEDFSQSVSDSDEETDGLVLSTRRVSTRRNGHSPLHPRWRLRRLRQGRQCDVPESPTHSIGQQQWRRRLQNDNDNSHLGYASSPTVSRRQLRHADNLHTTPRRILRHQHLAEDGDISSATDGQALEIKSIQHSAIQSSSVTRKRKITPALLTTTLADSNDTESAQPEMVISSPPVIDKPREERSYKEFFPDLNVHMPLTVQIVGSPCSQSEESGTDTQLVNPTAKESIDTLVPIVPATPVSSVSSQGGGSTTEQSGNSAPEQSRTSSSLSIKLVFNDPEVSAPPPALRTGKSTESYTGTPQSSVVVLAPKRPVVALPAAESRQLATTQRARFAAQTGFKRPRGHYIRNVELTEKDLAKRVEYDLDDMDREWLQKLNQGRSSHGQVEVSADALERIIDHIEKEWFDLVKEAQRAITQQQQESLPADESACAVCGSEECDNTNAIVFCDGCNLAVHQDCYGVPYIPEGQWLCRKCMLSPAKEVSCVLCPQRGGAFKKTTTNKWAHVLCALWIPEVGISNSVYMEPIDSVDQIPRSRWKLYCHLCHRKVGACIQCSQRQCFTAFHPTCARRARLSMTVRTDRRSTEPVFRAFCERHTPPTHPLRIDLDGPLKCLAPKRKGTGAATASAPDLALVALGKANGMATPADYATGGSSTPGGYWPTTSNGVATSNWPPPAAKALESTEAQTLAKQAQGNGDENDAGDTIARNNASLQLTMRIFDPARPVLNEHVFARVISRTTVARLGTQQRGRLIAQVARYWALKRSERHGAPLLKRLHLEPWTASVTQQRAHELEESQRQSVVLRIRTDLERVRLLVESVRRREREKLRRARLQVDYLRRILDPLPLVLLPVIDELLERRDPRGVLSHPVTEVEAPDYFQVITHPMDFATVRQKLLDSDYRDVDAFAADLLLVLNNCMTYNTPGTYYYQLAARVKRHVDRLMASARAHIDRLPINPDTGCLAVDIDFEIFSFNKEMPAAPASLKEEEEEPVGEQRGQEPQIEKELQKTQNGQEPQAVQMPQNAQKEQELQKPKKRPKPTPARRRQAEAPVTRSQQRPRRQTLPTGKKGSTRADPKRRQTLFELLSMPPPDTRKNTRGRAAHSQQPGKKEEAASASEASPDDTNGLKNRLRCHNPSSTDVSATPSKKRQSPPAPPTPSSAPKKARTADADKPSPRFIPTAARLGESRSDYPSGTTVWAKMESYPWFPAVMCDPADAQVPENVANDKNDVASFGLVKFFGPSSSNRLWRWVSDAQVCRLGVDDAVDRDFYRARKAKSSNMVRSVRQAYAEACTSNHIKPLAP